MKTIISLIIMTTLLNTQNQEFTESEALREVARQFIKSTDEHHADKLAETMHDQSMQYVLFGERILTFNKAEYLSQVREKKVGGLPRQIEFGSVVSTSKNIAILPLTATSKALRFHYQLSFFRIGAKWQIMSIVSEVEQL